MGRSKKVPDNIRDYIRKKTDWQELIAVVNKIARGGYTFQNYNGQTITKEPDIEAIKLLLTFGWGRPGELSQDMDNSEVLNAFASFAKANTLPKQKLAPKNMHPEDAPQGTSPNNKPYNNN